VDLFDLPAASGGDSPPPLMFLGEVPEVQFAPVDRGRERGEMATHLAPTMLAIVLLAIVILACLALGYAFGKTVLGA
jgi:hypothetical protein